MDARDAPEVTRKTAPTGWSARLWHVLVTFCAALMLVSAAPSAEASKRGPSAAKQTPSTAARDAATQPPAAAAAIPAMLPAAQSMPSTALGGAMSSAASGSRWLAPVAGLAAGLGIVSLASGTGFNEDLVSGLMFVMFVAVVLLPLWVWLRSRRSSGRRQVLQPSLVYAGVGQEAMVPQHYFLPEAAVGNRHEVPVVRPAAGATHAAASGQRIPADFDASGFVREARMQYLRLQAAHDAGDLDRLREFTSAELFGRIRAELAANGPSGVTEFPVLDVQLLGVSSTGHVQTASVRFRGSSRPAGASDAEVFDEVWSLTRPYEHRPDPQPDLHQGWVLAGIQPLR